ncbi:MULTISPECIES: GNAT family N-acetyltransferase [Commensalibacter]|uniref:GCN5-like N-acetyltransferase n=2 Tax=Commensalibacter TaxID=1079922 RepID=W7DYJ3_9PROT|nr:MULTISPECIES: GNAT family protein [Commensalibacter]EUK17744.1 GCN5-like N-acetyltransferase [Commensalibacter papalotli (ex Servin-Garciduenas et al. 2014)]CAI3944806.1 Protein N-acetyltransferase [Commensalibacter papalotli (ex Botero et al. 2024)]CAI3946061.1 Protein N-acetyltransferase [Commensalibacter papalotli (ex Botero et al. 2024)]
MNSQFFPDPFVKLQKNNIHLEPLSLVHEEGLQQACKDGELWNLRITSTPHYSQVNHYIQTALETRKRFAFAVINSEKKQVIGTTSYHDILPDVQRLEIGYTWYAKSVQKTSVNTICKLLLLEYAFEHLQAKTVGWRTDIFNLKSQRAIERLGAKKDGIIRGDALRKDGTIRDTVMYSVVAGEWLNIKEHLIGLLERRY